MSDFKGGGINTTDYDSYNTKYITQKTEFTDDVYVFGKLYAEFGGDVQSFSTAGVERVRIDKEGQVTINSGDLLIKDNHKLDLDEYLNNFKDKLEKKSNDEIITQLEKLNDLYNTGVLTEYEFKKAKDKILE